MKAQRTGLVVLAIVAIMLVAVANVHAQGCRVPQVGPTWSSTCNNGGDRSRDRYHDSRPRDCGSAGYGYRDRSDSFVLRNRHVNVEVPIGPIILVRGWRENTSETIVYSAPEERVVVVERQVLQPYRSDNEELIARIKRQNELRRQTEERARQELFEKLLKQLKSPSESERQEAVYQLAEFPSSQKSREALARVLKDDPSVVVRLEVVKAFAKLKDEETVPALKKALESDPDRAIQREAGFAIETIEMEGIFRKRDSEWKKDREEAIDKLVKIPNQEFARTVMGKLLLQDLEPGVREKAAEGLLKIGDSSSLPGLRTAAMQDPNKDVRGKAKKAIERINKEEEEAKKEEMKAEEEAQKAAAKPAARQAKTSKK